MEFDNFSLTHECHTYICLSRFYYGDVFRRLTHLSSPDPIKLSVHVSKKIFPLPTHISNFQAFRAAFQSDRGNGLCQYSPPALPPVANSSFIRTTTGLSSSLMYGSLACGTCFKVGHMHTSRFRFCVRVSLLAYRYVIKSGKIVYSLHRAA